MLVLVLLPVLVLREMLHGTVTVIVPQAGKVVGCERSGQVDNQKQCWDWIGGLNQPTRVRSMLL
eukprot:8120688-Alexandrium_andersonii.AAC.1